MNTRVISIITSWGGSLGNGHIQRMAGLAVYLNSRGIEARIICGSVPPADHRDLSGLVRPELPPSSTLIIRDMRDSSTHEIRELKKSGPVLSIDDLGPGRREADFSLDLLPNVSDTPESRQFQLRNFLYGINFTDSLRIMGTAPVHRKIDVALYPGHNPSLDYIDSLLSIIPASASVALFVKPSPVLIQNGTRTPLTDEYGAGVLLSSRVLISHFGITLYEARLAGCRLITVNPTSYHSSLADSVKDDLGLVNLGTPERIDRPSAMRSVTYAIENPEGPEASPSEALTAVERGLDSFLSHIMKYIM